VFVLALDTATAATAVAVVEFDQAGEAVTRAWRRHVDPRAHGEQTAIQINAALLDAGLRPDDLTAVVAGTGPGPFTGLRAGLATAAALGQALSIPTYGVCSLDGIGIAAGGPALVATDARRREIYWAVYDAAGDGSSRGDPSSLDGPPAGGRRITEPAVSRPLDVLPAIARYDLRLAYGEGALRYRGVLGLPVAETPLYPDPAGLVTVAYERIAAGKPGEPLTPLYLRRPDVAEPRPPKPTLPR
jgi:tRNA threonylcarbamoyl adenosine modification protein YeaZ